MEITCLSDRHFWHEGDDNASQYFLPSKLSTRGPTLSPEPPIVYCIIHLRICSAAPCVTSTDGPNNDDKGDSEGAENSGVLRINQPPPPIRTIAVNTARPGRPISAPARCANHEQTARNILAQARRDNVYVCGGLTIQPADHRVACERTRS